MKRILFWTVAIVIAACSATTLGPESAHARGGGLGGGRGSRGRGKSKKDKKERKNLLLRLQREQAEQARDDFRKDATDDSMVAQRKTERAATLDSQRESESC